jgi:hypothetical protein
MARKSNFLISHELKQRRSPTDDVTHSTFPVQKTRVPAVTLQTCVFQVSLSCLQVNPSNLVDISWGVLETNLITYPNEAMFL